MDLWAVNTEDSEDQWERLGLTDTFEKSPSDLFSFFTTEQGIRKAFLCEVTLVKEFQKGSAIKMYFPSGSIVEALVKDYVKDEFIWMNWTQWEGNECEKNQLRVRVSPWPGGKQLLSLVHSGFSHKGTKKAYLKGWSELLDRMKTNS